MFAEIQMLQREAEALRVEALEPQTQALTNAVALPEVELILFFFLNEKKHTKINNEYVIAIYKYIYTCVCVYVCRIYSFQKISHKHHFPIICRGPLISQIIDP